MILAGSSPFVSDQLFVRYITCIGALRGYRGVRKRISAAPMTTANRRDTPFVHCEQKIGDRCRMYAFMGDLDNRSWRMVSTCRYDCLINRSRACNARSFGITTRVWWSLCFISGPRYATRLCGDRRVSRSSLWLRRGGHYVEAIDNWCASKPVNEPGYLRPGPIILLQCDIRLDQRWAGSDTFRWARTFATSTGVLNPICAVWYDVGIHVAPPVCNGGCAGESPTRCGHDVESDRNDAVGANPDQEKGQFVKSVGPLYARTRSLPKGFVIPWMYFVQGQYWKSSGSSVKLDARIEAWA